MILAPVLKQRFFDSNGSPLAGGKLYTYEAGTTTPLGTYSDAAGAANANPVILDASGEANVWLDSASSYKFVLKNSTDVTQYTIDTVTTAGSVGTASIVDDAVTLAKIADDAVGADQLKDSAATDADRAVTTNHIRDSAVTTAKINDLAVTAAKVADGAVSTTAKLSDAIVTQAKLAARATGTTVAAGGVALSASCGAFSTTSTTFVDVTNLSVSLTTTGRPVMLMLIPDPAASSSKQQSDTTNTSSILSIKFLRDATAVVQEHQIGGSAAASITFIGAILPPVMDFPVAGTYVYKVQVKGGTTNTISLTSLKLVAYEI